VAQTPIRPDLHQPLDVEGNLASQVSLHPARELLRNYVPKPAHLGLAEIDDLDTSIDLSDP
jgi:hypothetical protein